MPAPTGGKLSPSGPISLGEVAGFWIAAGGPGGDSAAIAAYIAQAESGLNPGAIQQGQPYSTTGWGLWQITPGDSQPQAGEDFHLLNPMNNAVAAVGKYRAAGGWSPWESDPAWRRYVEEGQPVPSVTPILPPTGGKTTVQYVPNGAAPPGTHNSSEAGTPTHVTPSSPAPAGSPSGGTGGGGGIIAGVPAPLTGTGLSLLDVIFSPGSLGEFAIRFGEVLLGGLLIGVAVLAFAAALTGRAVSPSAIVAAAVPGGRALGAVWSGAANKAK